MTTDDLDREAAYGQLPTFSRLIQHFRRGTKDDELTGQLAEVVGMVKAAQAHGIKKAGTLAIKITVDPLTDDQVGVSIESQVRGPKLPPETSILYVDEDNRLATESPFAFRLPIGTIPAGAPAVDLPAVNHETGELL